MTTYRVQGMTCGGCARSVSAAIEAAIPGTKVEVELDGGKVKVTGEHRGEAVRDAVEDAGFEFAGADA